MCFTLRQTGIPLVLPALLPVFCVSWSINWAASISSAGGLNWKPVGFILQISLAFSATQSIVCTLQLNIKMAEEMSRMCWDCFFFSIWGGEMFYEVLWVVTERERDWEWKMAAFNMTACHEWSVIVLRLVIISGGTESLMGHDFRSQELPSNFRPCSITIGLLRTAHRGNRRWIPSSACNKGVWRLSWCSFFWRF